MPNPESTRYEIDESVNKGIKEMYKPCTINENGLITDYIYMHHMHSNYTPINLTEEDDPELQASTDNTWFPLSKKTTEDINLDNIKEMQIREYNYADKNEAWLKNTNIELQALSDKIYNQPQVELNE